MSQISFIYCIVGGKIHIENYVGVGMYVCAEALIINRGQVVPGIGNSHR